MDHSIHEYLLTERTVNTLADVAQRRGITLEVQSKTVGYDYFDWAVETVRRADSDMGEKARGILESAWKLCGDHQTRRMKLAILTLLLTQEGMDDAVADQYVMRFLLDPYTMPPPRERKNDDSYYAAEAGEILFDYVLAFCPMDRVGEAFLACEEEKLIRRFNPLLQSLSDMEFDRLMEAKWNAESSLDWQWYIKQRLKNEVDAQ